MVFILFRSAHKLILNDIVDCSQLRMEGDRMLIWKMKLPARVKIFLWRACSDTLPSRARLQRNLCNVRATSGKCAT